MTGCALKQKAKMKKILFKIFKVVLFGTLVLFVLLYFFQEKMIFHPTKLEKNYRFDFPVKFEEIAVKTSDNKTLSGLLFKSDSSKGLIFYLHGNAGALDVWGKVAKWYTDIHYDVFMLDYRGFGKSEGSISSEKQIYQDVQSAYNEMKKRYHEDSLIVLGYSIGTGPAAELASTNKPRLLILQAPYFSLADLIHYKSAIIPTFLLKYKFETNRYLQNCAMPVVIFHGDADEVIYYNSSVKLKQYFKPSDTLFTLPGQGHNGITENPVYIPDLKKVLN
jgi:uncharacterized protein